MFSPICDTVNIQNVLLWLKCKHGISKLHIIVCVVAQHCYNGKSCR